MNNDNFDVYEPNLYKSRVYEGWEIVKMVNDDKIKINDIIYNCDLGIYHKMLWNDLTICELICGIFKLCKVLTRDETIKEIRKGVVKSIINLGSIEGYDAEISYKNVTNDTLTKMNMNVDRWVVVYK